MPRDAGPRLHLDADQTRALPFSGAFELVLKLEIAEMLGKPTPYPPAGRSDDASPVASGGPSGAYSVTSLAKCWGVSTTMVYEEIRSGRLEAFKLGGKLYRIRKETVEAYEAR
jgi:excisionase family DNA binding protein